MAKRKKQGELPGIEQEHIKEIDTAAEHYEDKKDVRIAASREEKEAKQALIAVMRKFDKTIYRDDTAVPPLLIQRNPGKDDIKVTKVKSGSADAGEEDEAA